LRREQAFPDARPQIEDEDEDENENVGEATNVVSLTKKVRVSAPG
jgi:hypothetical protein